jgi:hypothetical protein
VEIAIRFALPLLLLSAVAAPAQLGSVPADSKPAAQAAAVEAPRAASREEWNAYRAAAQLNDPATLEARATDFAQRFPASKLRAFLFQRAMGLYERAHNPGKTLEMARAVLKYDPENPVALLAAAQVLANGARNTDLDRNARLAEARTNALSALTNLEKIADFAELNEEQFGRISNQLRGSAHEVLGTVAFKLRDYATALREYSIATATQQEHADPVLWLRISVCSEKTGNLDMSSFYAAKAISASRKGTRVRELAERQKDRIAQKLANRSPEMNSTAPLPAAPRRKSVRF